VKYFNKAAKPTHQARSKMDRQKHDRKKWQRLTVPKQKARFSVTNTTLWLVKQSFLKSCFVVNAPPLG
jgi:hypothetical protein